MNAIKLDKVDFYELLARNSQEATAVANLNFARTRLVAAEAELHAKHEATQAVIRRLAAEHDFDPKKDFSLSEKDFSITPLETTDDGSRSRAGDTGTRTGE